LKIGLWITGLVTLLLGGFLLWSLGLPTEWEAQGTRHLDADEPDVRALVSDPAAWSRWTDWPEGGESFSGPESGSGAIREWNDTYYGEGSFTISESREGYVAYAVVVEGGSMTIEGQITLTREDDGTSIQWTEVGHFSRNPMLLFAGRRIAEQQSSLLDESLEKLSGILSGSAAGATRPAASPSR